MRRTFRTSHREQRRTYTRRGIERRFVTLMPRSSHCSVLLPSYLTPLHNKVCPLIRTEYLVVLYWSAWNQRTSMLLSRRESQPPKKLYNTWRGRPQREGEFNSLLLKWLPTLRPPSPNAGQIDFGPSVPYTCASRLYLKVIK